MTDWEIIRIVEDVVAADSERWLVVYKVPTEYAHDGVYSCSMPKALLNSFAAAFEYDIDNPDDIDELFDHVMSAPMLSLIALSLAGEESAQPLSGNAFTAEPADLRREVKERIGHLKAGAGRLKAADVVELQISGMPAVADPGENPKYILKRDMVSRLDRKRIDLTRQVYRRDRAEVMRRMAEQGKGPKDAATSR